ncbi:secreted RxLR effector protein 161-like [Andrographis paniculata]|uniref:secreted RxLR effector protein 161-like n=1 Tax=Andrographis paniculata TaxID=175694 RepID=UPI0021E98C41|nr:secreted RxLR effector protein 161-like [Andrographis paniculata]
MTNPRTVHYATVLRILRYVKGTLLHGLHFSVVTPLVLAGFSDADWAGDPTDRRSITGYCFFLGSSLVSWRIKKQTLVSRSSAESEYHALADSTSELLWLRRLLSDLGVPQPSSTSFHCDSTSAIQISRNDVFHERTKHIEIDCHFVCQRVRAGTVHLSSVSSEDQTADIFAKSFFLGRFFTLLSKVKLVSTLPP